MDMETEEEEYFYWKKLTAKGKRKITLPLSHPLELKLRTGRQGKCLGEATLKLSTATKKPRSYTFISNEVWPHLAKYIAPEDVKNYALICTQSANSIRSSSFWRHMHSRYCQPTKAHSKRKQKKYKQTSCSLERLQGYNLKQKVIEDLYRCYPLFRQRLRIPYKLAALTNGVYILRWHKLMRSEHVICYKFQRGISRSTIKSIASTTIDDEKIDAVPDNWESLADDAINYMCEETQWSNKNLEGIFFLVIFSECSPNPIDILTNPDNGPLIFTRARFLSKRRVFKLFFVNTINGQIATVKYLKVRTYEVLRWWHPNFGKYLS